VIQNDDDPPYAVGPIAVDPATADDFTYALHGRYSGLNDLELPIARAIDRTQRVWCRNPDSSGYYIPLLDRGATGVFYPDFLVWLDRTVVAIETKGKHLFSDDARRKLFDIGSTGERSRLQLRMITKGGTKTGPTGQPVPDETKAGYTMWRWQNGSLRSIQESDAKAAVDLALELL
jgi:type III restriction enzyme